MPDQRDIPVCPYCHANSVFSATSSHLYSRDYGAVWECRPCKAWVGCHPDGTPLGRLADAGLRQWKMRAHAAFDPLWKAKMRRDGCSQAKARGAGYKWLAEQMGMAREDCHIGMMGEGDCRRVVEICRAVRDRKTAA